jgi:Tol biopolymer transport system component
MWHDRGVRRVAFAVLVVACGRVDFAQTNLSGPSADAPVVDQCAAELVDLGAFGAPTLVTATSSPASEDDPTPSDDGLELYFTSTRAGTLGMADVYRVARAQPTDAWGSAEHILELSGSANENTPELSSDGLTIWVVSDRTGTVGLDDIWVATRADRSATWSALVDVTELNSPKLDRGPSVWLGGTRMWQHSDRGSGTRFYEATRTDASSPWSTPAEVTFSDTKGFRGWVSPCGFELYYQKDETGSNMDLYYASRASLADPFVPVRALDELNSTKYDQDLRLSPDRRHAYFSTVRDGNNEIYEATR